MARKRAKNSAQFTLWNEMPQNFDLQQQRQQAHLTDAAVAGIRVGTESIAVFHLFYADDAIFLGELTNINIHNIVLPLRCFFLASVRKINLMKCKLIGVGVSTTKKSMASKKDGGLGIGSFYGFNRALLYKQKWRFRTATDAFWIKIITSIFGHDDGLLVSRYTGNSNSIWVNIPKASNELDSKNVRLDAW
ncbi:RNA-directed DNA polymerase, eukaryota, Reverse transcriptase zinc-binding domain protein [Artemisia annua]|uniref:RNA-directed DNA polymerase, eukaryota, Reverse transcriptase zinc-binding domain protein n=1 Tax=Artemisia annua TaxID=35608 RepID=A0A2U1M1Y6_ARTAN|nr:RNA-directed DNA polymerase, eukaryota, Reverse transcriptase zinc-binding domain protein [Artemisia annua]